MILKVLNDWLIRTNKLERFWLMARIEFKLRYYENTLGLLWALVKPVSDIIIYYIAFELILKQGVPQFVSFLFLGLVLWNFFVESSTGTITLLATKKYLYEYSNMNKVEIYVSVIGSNLIGFCFNLCMFLFYYLLFEKGETYLSWHAIMLIPILLNLIILSLAFSLILSTLYIVAKDIQQVWIIVIGLGFWVSPLLFKLELVRANLPGVDYVNPISSIIINARYVILDHRLPEWDLFFWGFLYASFFLLTGFYLLNKLGSKAAEKL